MKINTEIFDDAYYDIEKDIEAHPSYWLFVIMGGRHCGKTYGALKYYYTRNMKFMFSKRTNDDVRLICSKGKKEGMKADVAPFKSLNRDLGSNVQAFPIDTGLGGFYPCDDKENITGDMVGYIMSLNAGGKYKGSDFSECDAIINDEFVPQPWERVDRKEGGKILDLYGTVSRDRIMRGRPELKLICLSNSTNIYNPTCAELNLVDDFAYMATLQNKKNTVTLDDPERGIFLRLLPVPEKQMVKERETGFYKTMHDTQWGAMAWDNEFSYNDFSCLGNVALKGYRPVVKLTYKKYKYFIYANDDGKLYMTNARSNADIPDYNLNMEREVRRFYFDWCIDLIDRVTEGEMMFKNYTMYDIIYNFKLRFKIN